MKNIAYIVLLFFHCTNLYGQICNERYNFSNNAENGFSVQENDSGYVICGAAVDTLNFARVSLAFYDKNCGVRFTKSYGKLYRQYFTGVGGSLIKTYDNGYALGSSITDSVGKKFALLFKFDKNGDTLWTKSFGDPVNNWLAYQVKQTPDSGYVLVGVTNSNAFLIKTDSLGNEQWRNNYGTSATEYGFTVMCTSDGGYLIGGNRCVSCNATDGEISIFKVNASGNLVWQKQFGNPLYNEAGAIVGHEYPNGDYLFGQHYAYGQYQNRACVYRINSNGNLVWRKDISVLGYFDNGVTSIKTINDTTVLVGGHVDGHSGVLSGYICKLNNSGNIIMKRYYDYTANNFDAFLDVIQCNDGTYAAVGTMSDGQQDMWFVHTDEYGCLQPDCWKNDPYNNGLELSEPLNVGVDELGNKSGMKIYPNPADEYIVIELGENYNGAIKLYSIEGKLITTITANKGFAYLETTELVPGIYFVQTLNEEITRTAKFIINH